MSEREIACIIHDPDQSLPRSGRVLSTRVSAPMKPALKESRDESKPLPPRFIPLKPLIITP